MIDYLAPRSSWVVVGLINDDEVEQIRWYLTNVHIWRRPELVGIGNNKIVVGKPLSKTIGRFHHKRGNYVRFPIIRTVGNKTALHEKRLFRIAKRSKKANQKMWRTQKQRQAAGWLWSME